MINLTDDQQSFCSVQVPPVVCVWKSSPTLLVELCQLDKQTKKEVKVVEERAAAIWLEATSPTLQIELNSSHDILTSCWTLPDRSSVTW